MEIYNLPDVFLDKADTHQVNDIVFYDYKSNENHNKSRISLKSNLFSFLLEGVKQVHHPNQQIEILPSQFLGLKEGKCLMTEHLSRNSFYHSLLMFFDAKAFSEFLIKYEIRYQKEECGKGILYFKIDEYIQNFINSILTLQKIPKSFTSKLKQVKFEELMLYLIDQHGSSVVNYYLGSVSASQDIFFKNVIETNINNKLTLEELAFLSNMSLSTFKRKFKFYYGNSPSKWFLTQRLEKAKFLLKVKKQNPSQVFYEVGFDNLSSFTQAFKKEFNLTPKKFQLQGN